MKKITDENSRRVNHRRAEQWASHLSEFPFSRRDAVDDQPEGSSARIQHDVVDRSLATANITLMKFIGRGVKCAQQQNRDELRDGCKFHEPLFAAQRAQKQ